MSVSKGPYTYPFSAQIDTHRYVPGCKLLIFKWKDTLFLFDDMRKSFSNILFHEQLAKQKPVVTADLAGKTVIVTGANTGLGFNACVHFAKMNPGRLIMASRNTQRGEDALKRLVEETGCTTAEVWPLDLGSFVSVKVFVDRFSQLGDTRLDILVENAGITTTQYTQTTDKWESVLQANNISCTYHTLCLLPFMIQTAEIHSVVPRVVIVTSRMHYFAQSIDKQSLASPNLLERLSSREYCTNKIMEDRYNLSKLINIFFARSLSKRLSPSKIIVDVVDPGLCKTELIRDLPLGLRILITIMRILFAHTTEEGSRRLVFGALGGGEELHGKYMTNSEVEEGSEYSLSEEGAGAGEALDECGFRL